eukprot:5437436-Amphidinium_carterae.1
MESVEAANTFQKSTKVQHCRVSVDTKQASSGPMMVNPHPLTAMLSHALTVTHTKQGGKTSQ